MTEATAKSLIFVGFVVPYKFYKRGEGICLLLERAQRSPDMGLQNHGGTEWQGGRVLQPENPSPRRRLQLAAFSQVLHTRNTHGTTWEDLKASVWGEEKQTLLRFIKMKTRHVKHIRGVA